MQSKDKPEKEYVMHAMVGNREGELEKRVVPVSREVYESWYRLRNHLKYLSRHERGMGFVLMDMTQLVDLAVESIFPPSDFSEKEEREFNDLLIKLFGALDALSDEDIGLINALFWEQISMREYGRRIGVTHRTVSKRREKVLATLRELIDVCQEEGE